MALLDWLVGKKESTANKGDAPAREFQPKTPAEVKAANLLAWRASGQPRQWVVAHGCKWDHRAWLAILDELRASPYWPMEPDAVGMVLEEEKRQQLQMQAQRGLN